MAQDPIFSQFYNAPLQTNPAYVGNTNAPLIASNYRLQWPGFESVYNTFMVSYDQTISRSNSALGLYILSDDAGNGTLKTNKLALLYSYKLKTFMGWHLKFGMEAGIVQSRLDDSKLIFFDQLDPFYGAVTANGTTLPTAENLSNVGNNTFADVGAGIMLYHDNWHFGIGMKHLNNPDNSLISNIENTDVGIPTRITIHGGYKYDLVPENRGVAAISLFPNLLWIQQGPVRQLDVGSLIDAGPYFAGLWYRDTANNGDAIIGNIGVRTGIYKISYSYDVTISGLGIGSGGSHELGLVLNFDSLTPKESRYNDCFQLFR